VAEAFLPERQGLYLSGTYRSFSLRIMLFGFYIQAIECLLLESPSFYNERETMLLVKSTSKQAAVA
jgi:hypothetical protein